MPDVKGDKQSIGKINTHRHKCFPSFIIQRMWKITVAAVLCHARSHLSMRGEKSGGENPSALSFPHKSPIMNSYITRHLYIYKQQYLQTGILQQLLHLLQPSCLLQLQKHNESDRLQTTCIRSTAVQPHAGFGFTHYRLGNNPDIIGYIL